MVSATRSSVGRELGEWAAAATWRDMPASARGQVGLRLLDTLGLILVGTGTEAGRAVMRLACDAPGADACSLVGEGRRVTSASSALVHGTLAHCRDFDDTFADSVVHPGSVVIPAALAVAQVRNATDEDFCAAMVLGYEIAARLGALAGRGFHAHGFHATGVVGPVAAAVAAGRLMRLDGERMSWAMGLACSMSGGLMAFLADGGWSKWLHAGWAAQGGITAATLASQGFRGPEFALQGKAGLYGAFLGSEPAEGALLAGLGADWLGAAAEFKYYPCAHVIQPYIDATLDIVRERQASAADIDSIVCGMAPWAVGVVAEPREARLRFDTELEAIASLPYQLAMAVLERRVDLRALQAPQRRRPDVLQMARRIVHRSDPSFGQGFDGDIEVVLRSGERVRRTVASAGLQPERLIEKFAVNTALSRDLPEAARAGREPAAKPDFEAQGRRQAQAFLARQTPGWRDAIAILCP